MDDASSSDEDIDMDKINEDPYKNKSVEEIKDDPLLEQVKPLCMAYCELEDEEVKFLLCEKYDYSSCAWRKTLLT